MVVVGIDLGTSNLRISTWDPYGSASPQPLPIGQGGASFMPAVISLHRRRGGAVDIEVGENADNADNPEKDPNVLVIRNIKRYALEHDAYVKDYLESYLHEWPTWWNRDTRCVEVWGEVFTIKYLLGKMLAEAFRRASLTEGFDWAAGCPVHAGFRYRSDLQEVITELGGNSSGRVVEEPILFLTLAHESGTLDPGSYLVYDLGGGSFDCALAQVTEAGPEGRMTVFGADGDPVLGGANVDSSLEKKLNYSGPEVLLRLAKERALVTNTGQPLPGGAVLYPQHVEEAIQENHLESKTLTAIRLALLGAKVIWNRGEGSTPAGDIIRRNTASRAVTFVQDLNWQELGNGLNGIILCGGPTKSPLFYKGLAKVFPDIPILSSAELIDWLPDSELTAISAGACYSFISQHTSIYVNRLPARISLQDLQTGETLTYEPYTHLAPPPSKLFSPYVSSTSLPRKEPGLSNMDRYELAVTTPDGVLLEQCFADSVINSRLIGSQLRLVINRLGQVGVQQETSSRAAQKHILVNTPSWQTPEQQQALERQLEQERQYQVEESARWRQSISNNPFGWQEHSG